MACGVVEVLFARQSVDPEQFVDPCHDARGGRIGGVELGGLEELPSRVRLIPSSGLGALSGQRNYPERLCRCPMQAAPDRRSLQITPLMARPAGPSNGYEPSDPLQRRPRASGGPIVAEESPFFWVDHRLPAMDSALPYLLSTTSSRRSVPVDAQGGATVHTCVCWSQNQGASR